MSKYGYLYRVKRNDKKKGHKYIKHYVIILIALYALVVIPQRFDLSITGEEENKIHIGDYSLSYLGKYITTNPKGLDRRYYILYRVKGENNITEVIALNVKRTEFNSIQVNGEWEGVVSIYEDEVERNPYFYINENYYPVEKYNIKKVTSQYVGGTWVDSLYRPTTHELKNEIDKD